MKQENITPSKKGLFIFFKWIRNKVSSIFQPEEVEVTFNGQGKNSTYTYTKVSYPKVSEKQIA